MKKKKVVIFLYNRLFDALIQSNFWLYIENLLNAQENPYQFYLVTFEDSRFPLNEEQKLKVKQWKEKGLKWKQLKWNPGTGIIPKVKDIIQGFLVVSKLRIAGYSALISLASVAGTFAYLYSIFLRNSFFLYQFEPHSEYAIDNQMWTKNSLQYRLAHFLERRAANAAKVIASGTKFMQERLSNEWKVKAFFFKIPTVANDDKFQFRNEDRIQIRKNLGIKEDAWVLFYPGKFGDLYYNEEAAFMYKWLKNQEPRLHFLIVTPHNDEDVIALFNQAEVSPDDYTITHSDYADIHKYYSSADFAIISVPPGPSKKFISNIKVGEYLCSGLPYLITRGVSEDYIYAENENVGVVVEDFKETYINNAWPEIKTYLKMDSDTRRKHCREVGLEYRGFKKLNITFQNALFCLTND
jgi:hypothetical protein